MRKTLITLVLSFTVYATFSQSKVGLIAHWDMNGTTNDVSGNGHTGHPSNITAAAGIYGMPNTAYSFNGTNSIITAPAFPEPSLTQYSICAIVQAQGFYSGTCQGNYIITRGKPNTPGAYGLHFFDNAYDGNDCVAIDSTKDVFCATAGDCWPSGITDWQYTPQIIKNTWYKVVATWDGTKYKIYVNGALKNTVTTTTGTFGTSADSISIGMNLFEAGTGYPYYYKGLIDDIRLYNRVLTDSETVHYGDTCGRITTEPVNKSIHSGSNTFYTLNATIPAATYQWQQDAGIGFVNLSNSGAYSGVFTPTLTIIAATASISSYHYRCVVSNTWGCADTTVSALLSVTTDVRNILTNDMVSIYPNPANNIVSVQLPYVSSKGSIQLINEIGQLIAEKNTANKTTDLDLTELPFGIYIVRIQLDEQIIYKKVLKN